MKIVGKGKVNWMEDRDMFCSFEFKGKALKGYVTLRRESPKADIRVMRRAALPGERRREALEAVKVGWGRKSWREGRRPPWYSVWEFWFGLFRWVFKKMFG